jgi:hypothetical protein
VDADASVKARRFQDPNILSRKMTRRQRVPRALRRHPDIRLLQNWQLSVRYLLIKLLGSFAILARIEILDELVHLCCHKHRVKLKSERNRHILKDIQFLLLTRNY